MKDVGIENGRKMAEDMIMGFYLRDTSVRSSRHRVSLKRNLFLSDCIHMAITRCLRTITWIYNRQCMENLPTN